MSVCTAFGDHVLLQSKIANFGWNQKTVSQAAERKGLKKETYKRFWTMVWEDPRYKDKKQNALNHDPRMKRLVWYSRDIMPKCVLELV